jgi:hypothetical protein
MADSLCEFAKAKDHLMLDPTSEVDLQTLHIIMIGGPAADVDTAKTVVKATCDALSAALA